MKKGILFLLGLSFCAALAGCNKYVPLGGRVTFSDNGEPVTNGSVCFVGDTFFTTGKIDKKGNYVVTTYKKGDGLPPGTYKVSVSGVTDVDDSGKPIEDTSIVDEKFTDTEKSGISVNVDASTKKFDFKIDRAPPSQKKPAPKPQPPSGENG